jgi:hypothetical protein
MFIARKITLKASEHCDEEFRHVLRLHSGILGE